MFWKEDRGLSVLLVFLATVSFVAAPLAHNFLGGEKSLSALVSLLFAGGAYVIADRRRDGLFLACLALLPIVLEWVAQFRPTPGWLAASCGASLLFVVVLITRVARRVVKRGPVTVHHIVGATAVYLLIGLAFGEAARILDTLDPQAYSAHASMTDDRMDLYYFSFITLTTVGYGDITPVHPLARSLAVLEALIGQLFPAILIARLVSQELMSRPARE